MKSKWVRCIIAVFAMVVFISCGKDESDIQYYVKYELSTSSKYVIRTVEAKITTEKGVITMSVPAKWDGTFGPFDKLENLQLSVQLEGGYYNTTTFNGRISICRGNQPWVLKAQERVSNAPLSMSYQVVPDDLK